MSTLTVTAGGYPGDGIAPGAAYANAYNNGYRYPATTVSWSQARAMYGTGVQQGSGAAGVIDVYRRDDDPDWVGYWNFKRGLIAFDTSSLGATAIISAVTLTLRGGQRYNTTGKTFALNIYSSNASATFTDSDFQGMGTTAYSNTSIDFAVWNTGNGTNSFVFNSSGLAGINKTGNTVFGLRDNNYDAPNIDPNITGSGNAYVEVNAPNSPGYQSSIVITYTLPIAPTVTGSAATSVATTSMTGNGNITADGGATVTTRGFCYMTGTSGDPTTANSTAFDTGSFATGAYTKSITGLTADTNYRVRAYAINSVGTSYGTTTQEKTLANGPTTLSTWGGIAKASISTINGVALASVKTWNGIT